MASIQIADIHPAGIDFFQDEESFLNELTDSDMTLIQGQNNVIIITTAIAFTFINSQVSISQGISLASASIVTLAQFLPRWR